MSDNQAGDHAPAVLSADAEKPSPTKKQRGRPAGNKSDKKPKTPQQRIDRLKSELRAAEKAKQEIEARRDLIVGKVVVSHALADTGYRKQLANLLRDKVKGKSDLAVLDELLT